MHVSYQHEKGLQRCSPEFPAPSRPLARGDIIIIRHKFRTPSAYYEPGDFLLIMSRTLDAPYKNIASTGNLIALGNNGRLSVWSNIEWAMSDGVMELL